MDYYAAATLLLCLVLISDISRVNATAETDPIDEREPRAFSTESEKNTTELIQKYLNEVIDHPSYDKRIAPLGTSGPGSSVDVNVTMYFIDISSLNEQTMDFEAQFYLRQSWSDSRLKYHIPGVNNIRLLDMDKIWTPDLFFPNEKEGYLNKLTQPNILCKILPNGHILYSIRLYVKLACRMDLRNFPHDTQKCMIILESYAYSTDEVKLEFGKENNPVAATNSITAFNFDIIDVSHTTTQQKLSTGTYSTLKVILTFKRNAGFFTIRMYTPFALFVILSWISFWISSEERCLRLVFLLVILCMMLVTTSELDRWIPYTPYSKASDAWIGCCEALVFAAFLEFIFVAIYFKSEPRPDNSWGKLEMTSNMDNEVQERKMKSSGSSKSFLSHLSVFRCGRKGSPRWATNPVDRNSRVAFPIIFVLFNIIYWSVCASA